jgi:capsular polysaccharide transport system permease protein
MGISEFGKARFGLAATRRQLEVHSRRVLRLAESGLASPPMTDTAMRARKLFYLTFFLCVVIPTACAGVYYCFIASPRYVAESRFVIRGRVERLPGSDRVGGDLGKLVALNDTQEAHIIAAYIGSLALVRKIEQELDLKDVFGQPRYDFLARLSPDASPEDVLAYWKRDVEVKVEPVSGVSLLHVRCFEPETALQLSRSILAASEELANSLTQRKLEDAVAFAEDAARRAEVEVERVRSAERDFRDVHGVVDPAVTAKSLSKIIEKLKDDQIEIDTRLRTARLTVGETSPVLSVLQNKSQSLSDEIAKAQDQITNEAGAAAGSVTVSLQLFENLEVQREFAERRFLAAQEALTRARLQAAAQRIYLEVYDPPAILPARSRLFSIVRVFAGSSVLWGIAMFAFAGVRDVGS